MNYAIITALSIFTTIIGFVFGYFFAYKEMRLIMAKAKVTIRQNPVYHDMLDELERLDPDFY